MAGTGSLFSQMQVRYGNWNLQVNDISITRTTSLDSLELLFGKVRKVKEEEWTGTTKGECGKKSEIYSHTITYTFKRKGILAIWDLEKNKWRSIKITLNKFDGKVYIEKVLVERTTKLTDFRNHFPKWENASDETTWFTWNFAIVCSPRVLFNKSKNGVKEIFFDF